MPARIARFAPAARFIATGGGRRYLAPLRGRLALGAVLLSACAGSSAAPAQSADPALAAAARQTTSPDRRLQVTFDWNMSDRDARFSGRGVLRLDRAMQARVDLFGPRGETLAAAVLDAQGRMRVVPSMAESLLPPPAFLWAALGVFQAPAVPLTTTRVDGGRTTLQYAGDGARWQFILQDGRLRSTEWTQGAGRRTVTLTGSSRLGLPAEALFRDWAEFRELKLEVSEVEEVTSFDADVWTLPGER